MIVSQRLNCPSIQYSMGVANILILNFTSYVSWFEGGKLKFIIAELKTSDWHFHLGIEDENFCQVEKDVKYVSKLEELGLRDAM